jgi:hypothetical protein
LKDALTTSILPPIEAINAINLRQVQSLAEDDILQTIQVTPSLRVIVSIKSTSEFEPYVTLFAGAEAGTIYVIVNGLHPYYSGPDVTDTIGECLRQYIYDAIAEYQVLRQTSKVNPDTVRLMKDQLLRAKSLATDNENEAAKQSGSPASELAPATAATG